jgi:hypothetical protein
MREPHDQGRMGMASLIWAVGEKMTRTTFKNLWTMVEHHQDRPIGEIPQADLIRILRSVPTPRTWDKIFALKPIRGTTRTRWM